MASLCAGKTNAYGNHDGFVTGACAVGAAILGVAGAVALADWCCSETDAQLINRVSNQFSAIQSDYQSTIDYFGSRAGVYIHAPHNASYAIEESVLYEFATFVWNKNISQSAYRSGVWAANSKLQGAINDLAKRISYLERKGSSYEDQRNLFTMRSLLVNVQRLKADIALFADCLEAHKSYFTLYDSVGKFENVYRSEVSLLNSGSYSYAADIKYYILGHNAGRYPFKNFVEQIERDIYTLKSDIRSLKYTYEYGRQYATVVLQRLVDIKTIVVADSRYQQELYAYEQERLQEEQNRILREQERLARERRDMERDRINALERQNRILAERNHIERQKMFCAEPQLVVNIEL